MTNGYGKTDFAAVELVPLRRIDVLQAAALSDIGDPNAFLDRIDHLGISALASKPITLRMLLDTFQRDGDLPGNVLELYDKGCTILCEEQNESRRAAHRVGNLNPRERVAVAGRIAAVSGAGKMATAKSHSRAPSSFDELRKAYSYVLGTAERTVIPEHQNYQVRLSQFLKDRGVTAEMEKNFVDVSFSVDGESFIAEIKVTRNLTLAQAFRTALGQLLE